LFPIIENDYRFRLAKVSHPWSFGMPNSVVATASVRMAFHLAYPVAEWKPVTRHMTVATTIAELHINASAAPAVAADAAASQVQYITLPTAFNLKHTY